jgi:hypothetical protein
MGPFQPIQQTLRRLGKNDPLLLGRGYIISRNRFFLWVRVFGKVLTYTLVCHNCTSFA